MQTGRWLGQQTAIAALIGLQFGVAEALVLARQGFTTPLPKLLEVVGGHVVLAVAVALPAILLCLAAMKTTLRGLPLELVPPTWTLYVLLGATINVRFLRGKLRPESLAVDAALLVALLLAVWLWKRRPWRRRGDRVTLSALLFANLLVMVYLAWPDGRATSHPTPRRTLAMRNAPNVIVLLVDTLRADHMSIYGYERQTTPRIDAWGRDAAVFERAYSPSNWTRPAIASLHTSTMPSRHGVVSFDRAIPDSLPLLAELLHHYGYQTAFFTVGINIEPEDGYDRGVEHYYHTQARAALERTPLFNRFVFPVSAVRRWLRPTPDSSDPVSLTDQVLSWLPTLDPRRPLFLYVHYMGPHEPYLPPAPYAEVFGTAAASREVGFPPEATAGADALSAERRQQLVDLYDGEILQHDDEVGRLLDELDGLGRTSNAVVVLTSDHGESFGEHGLWKHGRGLFEQIVRVPLIIRRSPEPDGGRRISMPVSLLDVAPTILDLASIDIAESMDGASLRRWLEGASAKAERTVFLENPVHEERGLRTASWAYSEGTIDGERGQWLFEASDAAQLTNLASLYPELVRQFEQLTAERSEEDRRRSLGSREIDMSEARRERLRALGYLD